MAQFLQRITATSALLAALLTSGCADVPFVGPALESLKPFLSVLEPVITPIKGMLGLSDSETSPSTASTPRPRRAGANRPAQAEGATGSVAVTETELSEAQFAQVVERNKEFDRLRTTGLMQLYGGETRMAIDTFEQAAKIRPEDAHIRELIELAKNPPQPEKNREMGAPANSSGMPSLPEGFLQ